MAEEKSDSELMSMTAEIVCAYASTNSISSENLVELIGAVRGALSSTGEAPAPSEPEIPKPTLSQIKKSIKPEGLISFVDGKPYKSLKRHLSSQGMSLSDYRVKYGLPADYPMVAADYSAHRSELAKRLGLGNRRAAQSTPEAPKRRGRKPAAPAVE
jgi:predicted transcriptional regulator